MDISASGRNEDSFRAVQFDGDSTGEDNVYVYDDGEHTYRVPIQDIKNLEESGELKILDFSLACMLRLGFVPGPFTLYKNLYVLPIGDTLRIDENQLIFSTKFPYWENENRKTEVFSDTKISSLLSSSVEGKFPDKDIYVMQSGGKDSTAVMIALHEAGYKNVTGITYVSGIKEDESLNAKAVANKFDYKHITVFSNFKAEMECYRKYCKSELLTTGDFAFLPYLYTLSEVVNEGATVLDGMGNDIYMGHVPSKLETRLQGSSIPSTLSGLGWGIGDLYFLGDKISYLTQSLQMMRSERSFSGSRLSMRNIEKLLPMSGHTLKYYLDYLEDVTKHRGLFETRAYIRGRLSDSSSAMDKGRFAASRVKSNIYYPFCDRKLVEYFFNFEEELKYSHNNRMNKLVLRKYIKSQGLSGQKYINNKGSFRFDIVGFINANRNQIISDMKEAGESTGIDILPYTKKLLSHSENYIACSQMYLVYITFFWLMNRRNLTIASIGNVSFFSEDEKIVVER